MKGIIMEIENNFAIVLTKTGEFIKYKVDNTVIEIGQEIEVDIAHQFEANIHSHYRTFLIAASLLIALLIPSTAWAYLTPYGYVNIDINPSVELTYNRFDKVINITSLNEDGENLILNNNNLKYININDTIVKIVELAKVDHYISNEKDNAILVTFTEKKGVIDKSQIEVTIKNELKDINNIVIKTMDSSIKNYNQAKKNNVSPGKNLIIEDLNRSNNKNTSDLSVKELINEYEKINNKNKIDSKTKNKIENINTKKNDNDNKDLNTPNKNNGPDKDKNKENTPSNEIKNTNSKDNSKNNNSNNSKKENDAKDTHKNDSKDKTNKKDSNKNNK